MGVLKMVKKKEKPAISEEILSDIDSYHDSKKEELSHLFSNARVKGRKFRRLSEFD